MESSQNPLKFPLNTKHIAFLAAPTSVLAERGEQKARTHSAKPIADSVSSNFVVKLTGLRLREVASWDPEFGLFAGLFRPSHMAAEARRGASLLQLIGRPVVEYFDRLLGARRRSIDSGSEFPAMRLVKLTCEFSARVCVF